MGEELFENLILMSEELGEETLKIDFRIRDFDDKYTNDLQDILLEAFKLYKLEKEIACHIKKELDEKFSSSWHVVVGRNFGSYVTYESGYFIHAYVGNVAVMMFRTTA